MRPSRVSRFFNALRAAQGSDFILPAVAGCSPELGLVWMEGIRGKTVRSLIRRGAPPDPHVILDRLDQLWSAPVPSEIRPFNMLKDFCSKHGTLSHLLQDRKSTQTLQRLVEALGPFVESWEPSVLGHNDFYDAQMILTPEGRLALIDFEETAPGDPLLDVGTMLAHLRTMAHLGSSARVYRAYWDLFRATALDRFGWEEHELNLREAFVLFCLSTAPVRHVEPDWLNEVETNLSLVGKALKGVV